MRKRFLTFPLFLLAALILTVSASAAGESGRVEIANRSDANGAFSCDVKLSGGQTRGDVFAVLFTESGQMKRVSEYSAAESVKVTLQDVAATDYVKILWTDTNQMPLASPAVLRMSGNNAAAYAQFAQDLTSLKALEPSGVSESSEPYALARLIVSADALPDLSGHAVRTVSGPDHLHILQFKTSGEAERCKKYLESSPSVRYAEPDLIITANGESAGTGTPRSWGVKETGIGEYAESLLKRGINTSVTVAVVDSGVDAAHPFLKGRLVSGYDFVDRDDVPQDGHGHGTHVVGTVVDCTPGMKVSVMPVRVLDDNAGGTLLDIFLGIRYAADNGANVINLSLSLRSHSDMIEDAIRDAISKNITVVVAAGNYNGNAAFYCPAHTRDCITVAAVDSALKRYERSNYGSMVDVAAPGVDVESSYPGGEFRKMSGTSMAMPHVSAAAALLISELGAGQTPSQISAAIRGAARAIPKDAGDFEWQRYDGDDFLGAGFLDMKAFIPEPESQFYAHLYVDGEMEFQTSKTPDPNKTLVETYPVSASAGAGEYAAWHSRRAEIRTVAFVDAIRPDSTALWFYDCENLTEIRGLENLDMSAVTNMSQMFSRCSSLTTLDLTGLNTQNVTDTRQMFFSCAALSKIYASDAFNVSNVKNSDDMFMGCTSLLKYDAAHTDKEYARIDGGTSAPGYFTDKNAPQPSNDIYAVLYADGELVFQRGDTPESGRSVTHTYKVDLDAVYTGHPSNYAPWYNERESVHVVNFADKISPIATAYWFYCCKSLEHVDNIQSLDTANVTDMSWMFFGCSGLMALDVSHFNTEKVTDMSWMFTDCSKLTVLDVSHFNTTNVTFMRGMFDSCYNLMTLDVSSFNTANVTDMAYMFSGCHGLTVVNVSGFNTANVTFMSQMFMGCSELTTLDVSHFDTGNVKDMDGMFEDCSELTTLDVSCFDTVNVHCIV